MAVNIESKYTCLSYEIVPKLIERTSIFIDDLSVAYLGIFDLKNAPKYNKQVLKIDPVNLLAKNISEQIKQLQNHWPADME
jgi:hypothetical protein